MPELSAIKATAILDSLHPHCYNLLLLHQVLLLLEVLLNISAIQYYCYTSYCYHFFNAITATATKSLFAWRAYQSPVWRYCSLATSNLRGLFRLSWSKIHELNVDQREKLKVVGRAKADLKAELAMGYRALGRFLYRCKWECIFYFEDFWNVYERLRRANLPQTNNEIEGWHGVFNKLIREDHPPLWRLGAVYIVRAQQRGRGVSALHTQAHRGGGGV